jgi:peptidyl-prolyl cis-trans isomerase SurA
LRDYLALYENFRLKVREAEAMKLDTIPSLKNELEGYRKQLAKSYLSDREITDKLILEAYERSKTEVNASHILVKCDENANPADTLIAYKKILALRKRIEKGEPFEKVAKESSEDPSAKNNGGNIGWFSVFGTIYPFENAAYTLKKGELSEPVRTEFGYHLV